MISTLSIFLFSILIMIIIVYKKSRKSDIKNLSKYLNKHNKSWQPPKRSIMLQRLKNKKYDIIIIGGGSVGAGCLLDASTRGIKVALVEKGDFGCETSSRSTKLLHGGVRYFEKSIRNFDFQQLFLVRKSSVEKIIVMEMAPYLCKNIKFIVPLYELSTSFLYYFGLKFYEYMSGIKRLGSAVFFNKSKTVKLFPNINQNHLKGSIIYNDGIFDDSRYNLMLILTSIYHGGDALNYIKVVDFIKEDERIIGVECVNQLDGDKFKMFSKCVISTVGPFSDILVKKSGHDQQKIIPSLGTHIVISKEILFSNQSHTLQDSDKSLQYSLIENKFNKNSSENYGFVNKTSDGRIIIFVPWMNKIIIGSTDNECKLESNVTPNDFGIEYLLKEANTQLQPTNLIKRESISSVWAGIRPLVSNNDKRNTENILRKFEIDLLENSLVTVMGGKWTTFRLIAENTINFVIKNFNIKLRNECLTKYIKLLGYENIHTSEIKENINFKSLLGNRSDLVSQKENKKIHPDFPYTEELLIYMIRNEMVQKISDLLCRRVRIAFLDVKATLDSIDNIIKIFKNELSWPEKKCEDEKKEFIEYLNKMTMNLISK